VIPQLLCAAPRPWRGAADSIRGWIDGHVNRFRNSPKALTELTLVVHSLRHLPWSRETAERIRPDVDALRARITSPESALAVIFIDQIAQRLPSIAFAAALGPIPIKDAFALDMAGVHDCRTAAEELFASEWPNGAPPGKASSLYHVTHALFYATKLGTRATNIPAQRIASLAPAAAARIDAGHFDLGAELLLAMTWAGVPCHGAERLAAVVDANGAVPVDTRRPSQTNDPFVDCYHAMLVTLALLENIR
jgi:hypothetical protein